jgi:hypothetical protein
MVVDRAKEAAATIEFQTAHLPVMNPAGEQTEQDAGVQYPCRQ